MINSNTVYKYRNWSNDYHKDCLLKNQLYFSAPSDMNDTFDCRVTIDYSLLTTEQKRAEYVDALIQESLPYIKDSKIDLPAKKKELIERLSTDLINIQKEFDQKHFDKTNKNYGILSFSHRWDSILMWTHYSENHKGYCIGLNKVKLIESNRFGASGKVKYSDSFPKLDPLVNIQERFVWQTHSKARDWSYEEEYRFTNIIDKTEPTIEDRQVQFPDEFIDEIILGLQVSEQTEIEIKKIAKEKNIPLFKIIQKSRAFLLDKKQL